MCLNTIAWHRQRKVRFAVLRLSVSQFGASSVAFYQVDAGSLSLFIFGVPTHPQSLEIVVATSTNSDLTGSLLGETCHSQ